MLREKWIELGAKYSARVCWIHFRGTKFITETFYCVTVGMDEMYVNGDSYIPGARSLEPLFKERMFAEVQS